MDLSVIIVNYNVKAYLLNLLDSLFKSEGELSFEVIVVDNASVDGSCEAVKNHFPEVKLIENKRNVGFGRANNQALNVVKGQYSLVLNPDTIVNSDTLSIIIQKMKENPDVGIGTCKILNADGTLSKDTFRNKPTPVAALLRVFGLESKIGKGKHSYFINDIDATKAQDIPIVSGAFMCLPTDLFNSLEGFDDQFFMYFEDTDLCYRVKEEGYSIRYFPDTSIVHFRGESTRKDKIDHHLIFNKALYQFFKKHYSNTYSFLFRGMINTGIFFRASYTYARDFLSKHAQFLFDMVMLNVLIVVGFILRYDVEMSSVTDVYELGFLGVNALVTGLFISISKYYELYEKNKFSLVALFKSIVWSFSGVAIITFFIRDLAYSRLILGLGMIASFFVLGSYRLLKRRKVDRNIDGYTYHERNAIIVGFGETTEELINKIRTKVQFNYNIVGIVADNVSVDEEIQSVPVIGHIKYLPDLCQMYEADEILFQVDSLDQKTILQLMSRLSDLKVATKLIPESHEYMLGKNSVDYFGEIPAINLELAYQKTWNRWIKRLTDITLSSVSLLILFPVTLLSFRRKKSHQLSLVVDDREKITLLFPDPLSKSSVMNQATWLKYIFKGEVSFVGAPLYKNKPRNFPYYKYGLMSFRELHEHKFFQEEEKERLELFYLQNYAIWKDLEVMVGYLRKKINV